MNEYNVQYLMQELSLNKAAVFCAPVHHSEEEKRAASV
jgi:hypothetical protein